MDAHNYAVILSRADGRRISPMLRRILKLEGVTEGTIAYHAGALRDDR